MSVNEEKIHKQLDTMRIELAIKLSDFAGAITLFKYSTLTKEEFIEIVVPLLKQEEKVTKEQLVEIIANTPSIEMEEVQLTNPEWTDDVWLLILPLIETKISRPSFDTWFKNTTCSLQETNLIIQCANEFQRDWLEERYHSLIASCLLEVLPNSHSYSISFVCKE